MSAACERCLVVTFASTHDAMVAESALIARGVRGRLIPTPTVITSECGMAWRSPLDEKDALESALAKCDEWTGHSTHFFYDRILELEL